MKTSLTLLGSQCWVLAHIYQTGSLPGAIALCRGDQLSKYEILPAVTLSSPDVCACKHGRHGSVYV